MLDACFGNKSISIEQRRYLGSKTKLLAFIDSVLLKEKIEFSSFADIFGGTGVVANHFHERSSVILNDILESNYQIYLAFFGKQQVRFNWLENKLQQYNSVDTTFLPDNYFSINFANTYFDYSNSKLIGYIREDIERLYLLKKINVRERAYLITSLIYGLDRIANTVGHYDAFRKIKIPRKKLELKSLTIQERKYGAQIYKKDVNELVKHIHADVVYIDPPYNSRQYSDGYHLLENIANWKKEKVYGVAKKIDRTNLKSKYSLKCAGNVFSELINNIEAKYILVSYNDMGTDGNPRSQSRISDHEILSALERRGKVTVYEKPFNQFTTGFSKKENLKERIFVCRIENKKIVGPLLLNTRSNSHLPQHVKSPLNYTGGKHKLLPQITKFFPKNIKTFFDPFCGGANVGVNALAEKIICTDKSPQVIELLRYMQKSNFEELNQNLVSIIEKYGLSQSYISGYLKYGSQSSDGLGKYNKNRYLKIREDFNSGKVQDKNLLLLILILYGFNNQIRFNQKGHFNLPVGKRDYNGSSRRNLAHFNDITNLKNIRFEVDDFRNLLKYKFSKNDFVYLDPPYLLGLASYNESGGWSQKDEEDLYQTLTLLDRKGVRFALSNVLEHKGKKNTGLVEFSRINKLKVHFIKHHYGNSSYQSTARKSKTKEVLITNY